MLAASSFDAKVQLFHAENGELMDSLHGRLNAAFELAFSPDGRRLISTKNGREAVQLWDVVTGQELLTLAGADPFPNRARWSADGDVILAGPPWQAWCAPSWEEIKAAEAKEQTESRRP